jgi:PAS domain S-box-containing protein
MTTTETPVSPTATVLARTLLKAMEASSGLAAVFQKPEYKLNCINDCGRRWLDPGAGGELGSLTLHDIIGVNSTELLENEILLKLGLFGKWTGACTLRDAWGSEFTVQATVTEHPGETSTSPRLLCLLATKQVDGSVAGKESSGISDHDLLHVLLESLPDAIYFKDLHSRFIRVNQAMSHKICGTEPAAMIGRTDFDFFTADHARPAFESEQEIIRTGQPIIDLEEKETWPDGHVTWVSTTKMALRDRAGHIIGTFGISRDITARKQAELQRKDLQLQLAMKLEAIGRLAAGIAHETSA